MQRQVAIQAKQDELSQRKSIEELMEMSNLPQYNREWGDKENKEKAPMHYMAAIVWFFLKCEMYEMAPNIGNLADIFKVSRSQLSQLIMAKKFKSCPSGYVPKWRRMAVESETSAGASTKVQDQDPQEDELERYLVH